ncbi:MAG: DUF6434 domain-containing protein [Pseudomonadota bacterium]
MARPTLHKNIDADVFDSYYWYRHELAALAKQLGLSSAGGKFDIHDRISHYLRTGTVLKPARRKITSTFDWATETLSTSTVITDSYKNNANVHRFFTEHIGESFAFNIDLMNFMKENIGNTLADAVQFCRDRELALKSGYRQPIEAHNQFNLYTREFMADNPSLTRTDVVTCWAKVIEQPRPGSKGRNIRYHRHDLKYLSSSA